MAASPRFLYRCTRASVPPPPTFESSPRSHLRPTSSWFVPAAMLHPSPPAAPWMAASSTIPCFRSPLALSCREHLRSCNSALAPSPLQAPPARCSTLCRSGARPRTLSLSDGGDGVVVVWCCGGCTVYMRNSSVDYNSFRYFIQFINHQVAGGDIICYISPGMVLTGSVPDNKIQILTQGSGMLKHRQFLHWSCSIEPEPKDYIQSLKLHDCHVSHLQDFVGLSSF